MKLFKLLPKNIEGRDFVMGDLHGCFDQLEMFLNFINFNPVRDRLFSVGDLIDRGLKNLECLRMLNKPWFHAVKGNHEELMQDFLFAGSGGKGVWWFQNGGKWFLNINPQEKKEVQELVKDIVMDLPLMISVVDQFHVIHAELDSIEELTDERLLDENVFRDAALEMTMDGHTILWGRNLFHDLAFKAEIHPEEVAWLKACSFSRMFGPKLSHIYSGHTPTQNPCRILGQTNLDTGAFLVGTRPWAGLTFTEPASGKFWKVTDDVKPTQLSVIV